MDPIYWTCFVRSAFTPVKSSKERSLVTCRSCSRPSSSWSSICRRQDCSALRCPTHCNCSPTRRSRAERFPVLVADLVALKPAVIVVGSTPGILAWRKVTGTTPLIWFGSVDDPVALGLVESFARPGGNVTGFLLSNDASMVGKRLELLRDAVHGFSRVGAVLDPEYAAADGTLKALPSAARELGLEASVYEVRSGAELEARFAAVGGAGRQALYVPEPPLFPTRRSEIAAAAASVRLPAIYTFREFVQAGGLMSYGADLPALYQRAAGYVDKILKGAK